MTFLLLVGLGLLKESFKEFLVELGLGLKLSKGLVDFLLLAMRTFLVLWSSISIPLATLFSHVSLGLPIIFLTVLALVVLEASLLTWDSWVRMVRGTLLCRSAPLIRLALRTVATLWGFSRRGLLNQFEKWH
jgi:hypothetical protein